MNVMKEFGPEIEKALAEHGEWARPSYGNGVAGMVYGCLFSMGVCLYYIAGVWASMAALPSLFLFWLLCKYDKIVVSLWNQNEKDKVISKWLSENTQRIADAAMQPLDYEENLDGTNGDK